MARRAEFTHRNQPRTHRSFLLALVAALAFPAHAQTVHWEVVVDAADVKIELKLVTANELADLQKKYAGRDADGKAMLRNDNRDGLALLYVSKEDGSRRCVIYVADSLSGKKLADVLAHEALHCFGYQHE